jgi:GTP cyclohydrolase II
MSKSTQTTKSKSGSSGSKADIKSKAKSVLKNRALLEKLQSHVVLTSHPSEIYHEAMPINWGAKDPVERGPVVASLTYRPHRNAIGTHSGSYTVYRALATAAGSLPSDHRPDLTNTTPAHPIGPFPQWWDPKKIVSMDPWGAVVADVFKDSFKQGYDIRPSVAITKAHIQMAELNEAVRKGRIKIDGKIFRESHDVVVTKAAIEPVWYLPGIAERFGVSEGDLRKALFQQTGGMFPELVTRPDLKVLLPPIGSTSVYIFGNPKDLANPNVESAIRVHDECNGSDVFGSDICTCRPYLIHGIEEAIQCAQRGGVGAIIYCRKEGRALGEVTKFLVYNARKRQRGGDTAANYFYRTECVAGVQDMRFQELTPDILHWLGITKIDRFVSMSDMKYDSLVKTGIKILNRIPIPDDRIPADAQVEMEAKKAAGYFTPGDVPNKKKLKKTKGRKLND